MKLTISLGSAQDSSPEPRDLLCIGVNFLKGQELEAPLD